MNYSVEKHHKDSCKNACIAMGHGSTGNPGHVMIACPGILNFMAV